MSSTSGPRNAASSSGSSRGSFARVRSNACLICLARARRLGLAGAPLAGPLDAPLAPGLAPGLPGADFVVRRSEGMSSKDRRAGSGLGLPSGPPGGLALLLGGITLSRLGQRRSGAAHRGGHPPGVALVVRLPLVRRARLLQQPVHPRL